MAESAVGFLLDKLSQLLVQEGKQLSGVHREASSIKFELESIQSFLKDADARAEKGEITDGVKTWVKQAREVAYRIEDVIDEYTLRMGVAQHHHQHRHRFIRFLHKIARLITTMIPRHQIVVEIKDIRMTLREIKETGDTYGFNSLEKGGSSSIATWHDPRVASLFIEEAEVVGIESPRDELIGWLVEEVRKRTVISVVGMGGIGKTTLAKKVYDNQIVTGHFHCHAWITVSQSYKMEELLKNMMKQLYQSRKESAPEEINTTEETQLIGKLREYLQEKRYLVVFDDVWTIDFWRFIKNALPDKNRRSRIIITTRIDDVASSCKESLFDHVHYRKPLNQNQAFELFCKKAFQSDSGGYCPPELKQLSDDIVRRCEGLPLAIVAIGGLLSTKDKNVHEWQKLHRSLGSELESNHHLSSFTKILFLSYHDLPYYLKSCLLYFCIYPEDESIRCSRMIRQWIAEGFVREKKEKTLEEVAEEYLTELIHRSLVQVSQVDFDGKARSCRVHDLMREMILSKSEELNFCQFLATKPSGLDRKIRRLSISSNAKNNEKGASYPTVRSVFLFGVAELPKRSVGTLFANFKLLKILDFEKALLDYLPEDVGNLFHLRYLSLRDTKLNKLPKSIGKLHNLETLDLKRSLVSELPVEISMLCKLRHLLAYHVDQEVVRSVISVRGVKIQSGVGCLEALQKLYTVEVDHGVGLIKDLSKLRQLRTLGVTKVMRIYGKDLCDSIEHMNLLESLSVYSASENEIIDLQYMSSPPQTLRRLNLRGPLERLPDWISELRNLVRIRLDYSELTDDPVKFLQVLPNLLKVELHQAYKGAHVHFEKGGFQKLKVLRLRKLEGLQAVTIDEGALPHLEELAIGPSPQLQEVPSGIQHLKKLKTLVFYDMSREFCFRMLPCGGQDYWKVEHIPAVLFNFRRTGESYYDNYTLPQLLVDEVDSLIQVDESAR